MHTLNDINHEDMSIVQQYEDNHEYGLEAPTPQSNYIENGAEFYPSQTGGIISEVKYTPSYNLNKSYNNRQRYSGKFAQNANQPKSKPHSLLQVDTPHWT